MQAARTTDSRFETQHRSTTRIDRSDDTARHRLGIAKLDAYIAVSNKDWLNRCVSTLLTQETLHCH
jgi:Trk K+ transport system NAD-binding subunit